MCHSLRHMASRTFADKLRSELERREMGVRTLARQIDPRNPERTRRSLNKWLAGEHEPSQASRDSVTDALDLERGALDPDERDEDLPLSRMEAVQLFSLLGKAMGVRA